MLELNSKENLELLLPFPDESNNNSLVISLIDNKVSLARPLKLLVIALDSDFLNL